MTNDKKLFAYVTQQEYDQLIQLQKTIYDRQYQRVSISKLIRYSLDLLQQQDVTNIVQHLRNRGYMK